MKKQDVQALQNKSIEELRKDVRALEATRVALQFDVLSGQEHNVRKLRTCKRDIARLQTQISALQQKSAALTEAKK